MHFNNCVPKCCTLTVKLLISSAVVGRDVFISGKLRDKAHVTLGCGLNGGPQSDKWKHMATATETIECQHIDAHRGANLSEDHKDCGDDENRRNTKQLLQEDSLS